MGWAEQPSHDGVGRTGGVMMGWTEHVEQAQAGVPTATAPTCRMLTEEEQESNPSISARMHSTGLQRA